MISVASADIPLARWTDNLQRSVLRQMITVVSRPDVLSFAGGLPDPELFPRAEYAAALAQVIADPLSLQYRQPYAPLREEIARLMAERGVAGISPAAIFPTTGAQQALDTLVRLLLDPGGPVILEENIYPGIRQALAPLQPTILTIPTDLDSGLDVDALESLLLQGHRPAFLYTIPEGHNPTGVSMTLEKRQRLIELARRYRFPIIEDDPYGMLYYAERPLPPLRALDDEWVIYVGSFSKIIAPALRLGWLVAPAALLDKVIIIKEAADLETSALIQRATATYLSQGHLQPHLDHVRQTYRARRDAMLAALAAHFPLSAQWTTPAAGMFVWVELLAGSDTRALFDQALEKEQVAFIPGYAFAADSTCSRNCLRLTFSTTSADIITDGIARLGHLLV